MTPIDIKCPTCGAESGEKCTTVLKNGGEWVRVLSYMHGKRWAEFTRAQGEAAKLEEHRRVYGGN
jgi:hypothetical protein